MRGDKKEGGSENGQTSVTGERRGKKVRGRLTGEQGEIEYMPEEKMIKADCGQVGEGSCRRE